MANSVKSTPSSFEVVLLPRFFNYPQVHKNWTSPHQPREGLIAWGILSCLPAEIIPTIIGASHARPLSGEKRAISWAQKAVGKTASPKVLQRRACARPKHQPRLLHKVLVNFALVSLALLVKPRSFSWILRIGRGIYMLDVGWRGCGTPRPLHWPCKESHRNQNNCHAHEQPVWMFLLKKRRESSFFMRRN